MANSTGSFAVSLVPIILAMRINLVTPFSEKEAVKALGARWDIAKKIWYIVNVADLAPFAKWIPNMAAAVDVSSAPTQTVKPKFAMPALARSPDDNAVCGCAVLPWDDCEHTVTP